MTRRCAYGGHPDWSGLRAKTDAATRPFQLNGCEDPIDAVLCAYIALYAERRPGDVEVYGDFATGYIVTPRLPEPFTDSAQRAASPSACTSQFNRCQYGRIITVASF